jgi:membrane protein implicated in regulation of membrane protease activity
MHSHQCLAAPVVGLTLFAILPWPFALPAYLIVSVLALVCWRKGLEAMRLPIVMGSEALPGQVGYVYLPGQAHIGGETWLIESETPLDAGARVRVVAVQGLRLKVEPASPLSASSSAEPTLLCPACGRPISDRWTHCPYCGEDLL